MSGGERLGGYHLLPHVVTTRLGYTLERLLLGRMSLLLVQLPLSVVEPGREDVGVIFASSPCPTIGILFEPRGWLQ